MLYITPEDHFNSRITVHPSQKQLHIQPVSQPLYVVCAVSNPQRYYTRYKHYQAFEKHMAESGAILYTVELALRDRHHEITSFDNPHHIQLRSESELWHKENLINIGISKFPANWHYGAWIDADLMMTRSDWVVEAIHQLQHYPWVQLFSTYSDLNKNFTPYRTTPSFVNVLKNDKIAYKVIKYPLFGPPKGIGATGGAWAFRREAFNKIGRLLDICILGSADWHISFALAGKDNSTYELERCTPQHIKHIKTWVNKVRTCKFNLGYVDNHALHYYHGDKSNRNYYHRWEVLKKYDFNPETDIHYDWQGVLNWVGNKPKLEEAVRDYFRQRDEDA